MKRTIAVGMSLAVAGGAVWLLACGPFTVDLEPVLARRPADEKAYAKGDLGVVRPGFSLGYLLQAYRTLAPRRPAGPAAVTASAGAAEPTITLPDPVGVWAKTSAGLPDTEKPPSGSGIDRQNRHVPGDDYQTFLNCPDEAFAAALRTLQARGEHFGGDSAAVRDWTRAQTAVFDNCHDGPLMLPDPPPPPPTR